MNSLRSLRVMPPPELAGLLSAPFKISYHASAMAGFVSASVAKAALLFAGLLVFGNFVDARDTFTGRLAEAEFEQSPYAFTRDRKASADWVAEMDCPVHKMEHVHTIMDRVCIMCHEMFSTEKSTLRYECRKNCFDNNVFNKCLSIFTAPEVPSKKAQL